MKHVNPDDRPVDIDQGNPIAARDEGNPVIRTEKEFVGTGLVWGLIVGVLLTAVVVVLAAQNTTPIDIDFLGWTFTTSLIVLVLGGLLIGVVLAEISGLVFRAKRRRSLRDRDQVERLSEADATRPDSRK